MTQGGSPANSHAKSALRALDILELLARHVTPVPTGTVSRECDIPRSSTHHLLNALHSRGFVTYYESEHAWGIGPKLLELGQGYHRGEPLQRLAGPVLDHLVHRARQTAHLAILVGDEVLYLAKRQPQGPAPVLVTEVGVRLPAHLTASGRAILAALPAAQVRALYPDRTAFVDRHGTGPQTLSALRTLLSETRQRGYALEEGEVTPGFASAAVAVLDANDQPLAGLAVTWALDRPSPDVDHVIARVRTTADTLMRRLRGQRR